MPLREKNGKWEYRFKIPGQPRTSKLTDLAATEPNKKRAERLEQNHRDRILRGLEQARRPKPITFAAAVEEFLAFCRVEHADHPNTSERVKVSMTSLLAVFGQRPVTAIDVPDVERYKTWRLGGDENTEPVKAVTARHDLDALSKFFQWAITMRHATFNPVRAVKKPSIEDAVRMYILSDAEEFAYFERALARSIDLHDVATLMVNQGMRPEEVVEIEKKNIDFVGRTLRITKGKTNAARRTLRLTAASLDVLTRRMRSSERSEAELKELCDRLAKRLKVDPEKIARRERQKSLFVFPARKFGKKGKGHISLSGLEKCHDDTLDACKKAGQTIPFVLYDLRHTFATRAAQEGMPLPTLASVLGHASLRLVQKYVHPTQDHQQVEMDRIDKIRQETKRLYAESVQAQHRPTTTGISRESSGTDGQGRETVQ